MVGRERGVGGAARQLDHVALFVGHEAVLGVGLADAAQVADIVRQGRQDDMQPHVGRHVGAQAPPAQDVLRHQCHQGGVLGGVIERVAERQPFDHQPRRFAQELGLLRHRAPVAAHERPDEAVRQGVGQEGRGLKHDRALLGRHSAVPPSGGCVMPPVEERAVGHRQVVERHVDRLDDDLGLGRRLVPWRRRRAAAAQDHDGRGSSARAGLARAIRAKSRLAMRIVASARRTVPPSGERSR